MATIAGAAANRILDKVGTLTPGKEADIVVLDARNINTWPMNNVPGTIVTMMNPRHVRDVLIAGKVVYWKGTLVGWDVEHLLRQAEQARDRVLAESTARRKSDAATGQQQRQQPVPAEFPGRLLPQGDEHHGAGVRVEAVATAWRLARDWRGVCVALAPVRPSRHVPFRSFRICDRCNVCANVDLAAIMLGLVAFGGQHYLELDATAEETMSPIARRPMPSSLPSAA